MDVEAIIYAEDAVLKRNGLIADGDIIRLRIFCRSDNLTERKSHLKNVLASTSRKSPKGLQNPKNQYKTFFLSWENYDRKKDKWCIVKSEKGGGSKQVKISLDSTKDDILKLCMTHFWEKQSKKYFTDSYFMLAKFKHEIIGDIIDDENNPDLHFTLRNYSNYYKMARPRIFFRTKPKTPFQRLLDNVSNKTDSDDDFDTFQPLSSSRANLSFTPATTSRNYSSPTSTSTFRHYSSSPISTSTIMAIIFETKGEFLQNFETTSDLEVLYFKVGLQSFNSEF